MSSIENFLSSEEEQDVIEAIRTAERETSGEIRVHLEASTKGKDIIDRASEVFHLLKMDNTKTRNGVLLYIAVEDRNFVIFGDEGINNVVPVDFWENTKNVILKHFKQGRFKQGIIDGIKMAGKELGVHFPWDHNDNNELSDKISRG